MTSPDGAGNAPHLLHAKSWHVGITRETTAAEWAAAQVEHVRDDPPYPARLDLETTLKIEHRLARGSPTYAWSYADRNVWRQAPESLPVRLLRVATSPR